MKKQKTFAGISVGLAALAGIQIFAGSWDAPRTARGAAETKPPSTQPVKWVHRDELAHEFLDFETARLTLIQYIDSVDEPKLKEALPVLQAATIREILQSGVITETSVNVRLSPVTIDLRAKKWSADFYDGVSGTLKYSGEFFKNETGQWKTRLGGKGWSGH